MYIYLYLAQLENLFGRKEKKLIVEIHPASQEIYLPLGFLRKRICTASKSSQIWDIFADQKLQELHRFVLVLEFFVNTNSSDQVNIWSA